MASLEALFLLGASTLVLPTKAISLSSDKAYTNTLYFIVHFLFMRDALVSRHITIVSRYCFNKLNLTILSGSIMAGNSIRISLFTLPREIVKSKNASIKNGGGCFLSNSAI
jgi:hypothetical protein